MDSERESVPSNQPDDLVALLRLRHARSPDALLRDAANELERLRAALGELRIRFHAAGRRPEECHEMSLIDEALRDAAETPAERKPCADDEHCFAGPAGGDDSLFRCIKCGAAPNGGGAR